MLNVLVDMGNLHCGMQMQQWNNGIVKNVRHNDATIFHTAHCVSLSIFKVLTQAFSVLKSFCRKCKKIDI